MEYKRDTELRKLRPAELFVLAKTLYPDVKSDSWKILMGMISKPGLERKIPRFNGEHISMIEAAAQKQQRFPSEIFLEEWSTMGKERPTLGLLVDLLVEAELFRAADYLAVNILGEQQPKRPAIGPAAAVVIPDPATFIVAAQSERPLLFNNETICEESEESEESSTDSSPSFDTSDSSSHTSQPSKDSSVLDIPQTVSQFNRKLFIEEETTDKTLPLNTIHTDELPITLLDFCKK